VATIKYVDKVLLPGEEVIHRARLHWIVFLQPIVFLIVAIAALWTATEAAPTARGEALSWSIAAAICLIFAILGFMYRWTLRDTTEFALTNHRILYKAGLIRPRTIELNVEKIEGLDVDQSMVGRLLNYGSITVRGTGQALTPIHRIARPVEFRNAVSAYNPRLPLKTEERVALGRERMKPFTAATVAILTIIAVVHLLRLVAGWEVTVSGFIIPVWWSAPGFIVAAGLAFMLWHETRR
jgi:Bacterial PH domain